MQRKGDHLYGTPWAVSWETSDIRSYLNNDFYLTFTESERERIRETKVINSTYPWTTGGTGKNTDDMIFLLSIQETVKYFGDSGILENRGNKSTISDEFNDMRKAKDSTGVNVRWWLRSSHEKSNRTSFVGNGGVINILNYGNYFVDASLGVRPALWLKIN